uniref:DUF659 domain-containing protein n=1 Tax=Rhabditophanes sp. KR3021 TaxID=114890 RepID=A0AC35TMF1_9BILA
MESFTYNTLMAAKKKTNAIKDRQYIGSEEPLTFSNQQHHFHYDLSANDLRKSSTIKPTVTNEESNECVFRFWVYRTIGGTDYQFLGMIDRSQLDEEEKKLTNDSLFEKYGIRSPMTEEQIRHRRMLNNTEIVYRLASDEKMYDAYDGSPPLILKGDFDGDEIKKLRRDHAQMYGTKENMFQPYAKVCITKIAGSGDKYKMQSYNVSDKNKNSSKCPSTNIIKKYLILEGITRRCLDDDGDPEGEEFTLFMDDGSYSAKTADMIDRFRKEQYNAMNVASSTASSEDHERMFKYHSSAPLSAFTSVKQHRRILKSNRKHTSKKEPAVITVPAIASEPESVIEEPENVLPPAIEKLLVEVIKPEIKREIGKKKWTLAVDITQKKEWGNMLENIAEAVFLRIMTDDSLNKKLYEPLLDQLFLKPDIKKFIPKLFATQRIKDWDRVEKVPSNAKGRTDNLEEEMRNVSISNKEADPVLKPQTEMDISFYDRMFAPPEKVLELIRNANNKEN